MVWQVNGTISERTVFSIGLIVIVFVILVVSITIFKMVSGKRLPDNSYTPYDHITGQTDIDFHDEKKDGEEEDDD
ncbi:DUF3951 domain-containing protein [Gracilibacillus caseinilyticus]|uniref:DUF3951 domain-containing protein n=1 Tax=Gracilibacillus caseinilyticus TaxID=2932256 RepID=A0ABY4EZZ5_9BACI|nr:DUF3951 domain-containing protein [Gracilibacillus caseinilyticus]UOQ49830.1 DUF3951 domain-containing protein [Gracilibacillus caseinilyticus]